jgi:SET and MYND domain-containing protein
MASRVSLPSVETRTVPRQAPNGMGNGLFATSDIKPGEDVLHIKTPFVAVLDSPRLEDTCAGCFGKRQMETGNELKACTGCRVVKYCDRVSFRSFDSSDCYSGCGSLQFLCCYSTFLVQFGIACCWIR